MKNFIYSDLIARTKRFSLEAHKILGKQEDSKSRIISLGSSYKALQQLSIKQDDLFRQAFKCLERECFRAAHVMSWAGFMDFLEEKIFEDNGAKIKSLRPKWKSASIEELREDVPEFQIIDSLKDLGLCTKTEVKALQGLLNKRNECAHPSDYYPGLNDSLGYISELMARIETIGKKKLV